MSRLTSIALLLFAAVLSFFVVAGDHGLLHLQRLQRELGALEAKNREIESEIVYLSNRIYAIEHSPEALEREAREQLGLSKPGEIVYIFPESSNTNQVDEQQPGQQPAPGTE